MLGLPLLDDGYDNDLDNDFDIELGENLNDDDFLGLLLDGDGYGALNMLDNDFDMMLGDIANLDALKDGLDSIWYPNNLLNSYLSKSFVPYFLMAAALKFSSDLDIPSPIFSVIYL